VDKNSFKYFPQKIKRMEAKSSPPTPKKKKEKKKGLDVRKRDWM